MAQSQPLHRKTACTVFPNRSTKDSMYARRIRDTRQAVGYSSSKNIGHSESKNSTHWFYLAKAYLESEKLNPGDKFVDHGLWGYTSDAARYSRGEVEDPGSLSHEARWVVSVVCNEPASIATVAAHHIPAGCIQRA